MSFNSRSKNVLLLAGIAVAFWGEAALLAPTVLAQETEAEERFMEPEAEIFEPLPEEGSSPEEIPFPQELLSPSSPSDDSGVIVSPGRTAYLLGPGDQVNLTVINFDELTQEQIVLPDGTVSVPLIGSVVAAGKTVEELQQDITERLVAFLVDPVVEISLLSLRPVIVTVGGAVNRPGPVQLESLTATSTQPTLSTALISAGGVLRTADLQAIRVQRELANGRQQVLNVNLWDAIFRGIGGEDAFLQDGDIVFVPEAPEDSEIDPRLVASTSLAPETVTVRVIGEVNGPGERQIPPNSNVLTAIAAAGGHSSDANLKKVALLRIGESGQLEGQRLNLKEFDDTTAVQNGDVIVVPKRGYLTVLDDISRTLQPITAPFNFLFLFENFFGGNND